MSQLRVRYQTLEIANVDIHLRTLRDTLQFEDDDGVAEALGISSAMWPVFGVVWASGLALARLMSDFDVGERRVLEVGCGIGLASLVLNQRTLNIMATDYHPEAGGFLAANVKLNGQRAIPFVRTGWDDDMSNEMGAFDLIVGSDLLYEDAHADSLSAFINQHAAPTCEVIIIDPGRGEQNRFDRRMSELGYSVRRTVAHIGDDKNAPFRGHVLQYGCRASVEQDPC